MDYPTSASLGAVACIGGAHVDRRGMLRAPLVLGTSNPGEVFTDVGGVARNVAENLARLGVKTFLVSRVGSDPAGAQVRGKADSLGIDTSGVSLSSQHPTASYTAILEKTGELVIGLADMDIYDEVTPEVLAPALARMREVSYWFVDCNLPGSTIDWILSAAGGIPVSVDAISVAKSQRLVPLLRRIPLLFANTAQAAAMAGGAPFATASEAAQSLAGLGAQAGIVTAGDQGIAAWSGNRVTSLRALKADPRDVTGAGDALIAATLFGLLQGAPLADAAQLGLAAAAITVESSHAVAPELTPALLKERYARG